MFDDRISYFCNYINVQYIIEVYIVLLFIENRGVDNGNIYLLSQ